MAQRDELFTPKGYIGQTRFVGQNIKTVITRSDLQLNCLILGVSITAALYGYLLMGKSS